MTDKTTSQDPNHAVGKRLKKELIEIHDEISELLESASKLKISRAHLHFKVKLIDDEKARILLQEIYRKRTTKPEILNSGDPLDEYLKKRPEIEFQLDFLNDLKFVDAKMAQNGIIKEDSGKFSNKSAELYSSGGALGGRNKHRKEKDKSSGFHEPETLGFTNDNKVDLSDLYRRPRRKEQMKSASSPVKDDDVSNSRPGEADQSLPNKPNGEYNIQAKLKSQRPAESEFKLKSILIEQKKSKLAQSQEIREEKPATRPNQSINQSRYNNISGDGPGNLLEESKDESYSRTYQKDSSATKLGVRPIFCNPFDPNIKNSEENSSNQSMQEKNPIQQADALVVGTEPKTKLSPTRDRKLAEKLLRPDSSNEDSVGNSTNRDKQEDDSLISGALKDLRQLNAQEKKNKAQQPPPTNQKKSIMRSEQKHISYDSTFTNSDLGTAQKTDRGFDWAVPENFSPYMKSQKYDFQKPIEEEEFEQTQRLRAIRLGPTEEEELKKAKEAPVGEERGGTLLNVKNPMPDWYGQDPNTELIENMYMVDAVRYNNFSYVHHPSQSPEKKARDSSGKGVRHSSPSSQEAKNLSHKLENPKAGQKFDKRIPRIICFVTKYNGGDLEEDDDRDDNEDIGKEFDQNMNRVSPNDLQAPNTGKKHVKSETSDQSFDFDGYIYGKNPQRGIRRQLSGVSGEEDEGVRQSVRPSISYPNHH